MKYTTLPLTDLNVSVRLSSFEEGGAGEYHALMEGTDALSDARTQYANLAAALRRISEELLPAGAVPVLKRYFVSDAANLGMLFEGGALPHGEAGDTSAGRESAAVSIVQQPPLNGTKVSLWCWFVEGARMIPNGERAVVMEHSSYRHLFDMQMHSHLEGESAQTEDILGRYTAGLERQGLALASDVLRTWIFVQGVDTHYADMVKARRLFFSEHGLTELTHYIASTGIEGRYIHPETTVLADFYAVGGLQPGQITYLKGATHLNPTHEYGVTFERATALDYGDRRHLFVSGTASIDNRGRIVFPMDVAAQTGRTLENIEVLLREGDMSMADVAQMIVYLRDTADHGVVAAYLEERFPDTPKIILWAPVCRPGWLVEIECIAIRKAVNEGLAPF